MDEVELTTITLDWEHTVLLKTILEIENMIYDKYLDKNEKYWDETSFVQQLIFEHYDQLKIENIIL